MAAVTASCAVTPARRPVARVQRANVARGAQKQRVTLTRRGRLVVSTALIALVLAVVAVLAALVLGPLATPAAATSTNAAPALASVVVHPGETLWSIATRVAPNADPRETITALREVNNLPSADVYPGERLIVPAGH